METQKTNLIIIIMIDKDNVITDVTAINRVNIHSDRN